MRLVLKCVAVALFLTIACAQTPEPISPPVNMQVGVHNVMVEAPQGWLHLDHGLEHRFHKDLMQISIHDYGPVTREAYLREIFHARELFRANQAEDAQAHLDGLDLRSLFPDEQRWLEFKRSSRLALNLNRSIDITRVDSENAWNTMIWNIERLEDRDLELIVEAAWPSLDTSAHREVAESRQMEIDACIGIRLETWDRLSHDHRRSFLFVLNRGNLLVVQMEMGQNAEMAPAYEALVSSLSIHGSEEFR